MIASSRLNCGPEPALSAAAFWSAPVLWRFRFGAPSVFSACDPEIQSARGLAHSKTAGRVSYT